MVKKRPKSVVAFKFPAEKEHDRLFRRYFDMRDTLQALAVRWKIPCSRCHRELLESKISAQTEYWVFFVHPKDKVGDLVTFLGENLVEEVRVGLNVPSLLRNASIECIECCGLLPRQFLLPQSSQSEAEDPVDKEYQKITDFHLVEKKPPKIVQEERLPCLEFFTDAIAVDKLFLQPLPQAVSSHPLPQLSPPTIKNENLPPLAFDSGESESLQFPSAIDLLSLFNSSMDYSKNLAAQPAGTGPKHSKKSQTERTLSGHCNKKPSTSTTEAKTRPNLRTSKRLKESAPKSLSKEECAIFNKVIKQVQNTIIDKVVETEQEVPKHPKETYNVQENSPESDRTENKRPRPIPPPFPKRKLSHDDGLLKKRPVPPPFPSKKADADITKS